MRTDSAGTGRHSRRISRPCHVLSAALAQSAARAGVVCWSFCALLQQPIGFANAAGHAARHSASGGSEARPKKAKEAYDDGVRAERKEDWEAAYAAYSDAVNLAPNNHDYLLRREIAKSRLVQNEVDAAERDAVSGRLDDARQELLARELRRSIQLDRARQAGGTARREAGTGREGGASAILQGKYISSTRSGTNNFDYRGDTQGAYEEIGKQFGVEMAFDVDLHSRQVHFHAERRGFSHSHAAARRYDRHVLAAADAHLFFVTDDTPQKRKDYDVSMVRTILLARVGNARRDDGNAAARCARSRALPRSDLDINSPHADDAGLAASDGGRVRLDRQSRKAVRRTGAGNRSSRGERELRASRSASRRRRRRRSSRAAAQQIQEAEWTSSRRAHRRDSQQVFGSSLGSRDSAAGGFRRRRDHFSRHDSRRHGEFFADAFAGETRAARSAARAGRPAGDIFRGRPHSRLAFELRFEPRDGVERSGISSLITNPITNYPTGNSPSFVATTSLRNDGINDLIVANSADNTVSVLLGNGDGTFAPQVTYPTGDRASVDRDRAFQQRRPGTTTISSTWP